MTEVSDKVEAEEKPDKIADKSTATAAEKHEDDSIKWREKYKFTKGELEAAKLKAESEKQELATKVETTAKERQMYEKKYIDAEVKAQAVAAGIKDIEFVKLIDTNEIKLDDKGNVIGVDKAISDLKTRKPDWFGAEKKTSTSSNADFVDKEKKMPLDARSMSKEEWQKNRSNYMAGHF